MDLLSLSHEYEDNPIARAIVNAIPYIGGSIDVALSAKWTRYHSQRIDDLLDKINNELSRIDATKIDKSFLESEEFSDLVYSIAFNTIKTRNPEIRTGFARIIKSALIQDDTVINLEDIVRQLSEMTQNDLLLLKTIKELYDTGQPVAGKTVSKALYSYNYSEIEAEIHLYRFENLGLLDHPRNRMSGRGEMAFTKMPLFDKTIGFLGL